MDESPNSRSTNFVFNCLILSFKLLSIADSYRYRSASGQRTNLILKGQRDSRLALCLLNPHSLLNFVAACAAYGCIKHLHTCQLHINEHPSIVLIPKKPATYPSRYGWSTLQMLQSGSEIFVPDQLLLSQILLIKNSNANPVIIVKLNNNPNKEAHVTKIWFIRSAEWNRYRRSNQQAPQPTMGYQCLNNRLMISSFKTGGEEQKKPYAHSRDDRISIDQFDGSKGITSHWSQHHSVRDRFHLGILWSSRSRVALNFHCVRQFDFTTGKFGRPSTTQKPEEE